MKPRIYASKQRFIDAISQLNFYDAIEAIKLYSVQNVPAFFDSGREFTLLHYEANRYGICLNFQGWKIFDSVNTTITFRNPNIPLSAS